MTNIGVLNSNLTPPSEASVGNNPTQGDKLDFWTIQTGKFNVDLSQAILGIGVLCLITTTQAYPPSMIINTAADLLDLHNNLKIVGYAAKVGILFTGAVFGTGCIMDSISLNRVQISV